MRSACPNKVSEICVGTKAPPVAEICLKPCLDSRPDEECMSQ